MLVRIFISIFFMIVCLLDLKGQEATTIRINDPDSYTPVYVNVEISPALRDGTVLVVEPITLSLQEALRINLYFSLEPQNTMIDQKFVLSNFDQIDSSILKYGDAALNYYWFPQAVGTVTLQFQLAWHEKSFGPRGTPIIVDKNGPSKIETIQCTINVVE